MQSGLVVSLVERYWFNKTAYLLDKPSYLKDFSNY